MRKILLSLLLIVMLSLGGASLAQEFDCGGLSDADCAILQRSAEVMEGLTSAAFNFDMLISIDNEVLGLSGNGTFNLDNMTEIDPLALNSTDPTVALNALGEALSGLNASLNLSINAPDAPPITLNLLLINNVGYLNFESLAFLLGGPETLTMMGLPTGWAGLDLADVLSSLGLFLDPSMMGDMGMDMDMDTDMEVSPELEAAVAGFSRITRLPDVGGEAVFRTDIDFAGLLEVEEFRALVDQQLAAQGQAQDAEMIYALLREMDISVTQTVDLNTFFNTSIVLSLALDVANVMPGEQGSVVANIIVNLSGFNSTAPAVAPAGAPVATFMDLFMLLGATGGF